MYSGNSAGRHTQNDVRGVQGNLTPDLTLTLAATVRGVRGWQGCSCHACIADEVYEQN